MFPAIIISFYSVHPGIYQNMNILRLSRRCWFGIIQGKEECSDGGDNDDYDDDYDENAEEFTWNTHKPIDSKSNYLRW